METRTKNDERSAVKNAMVAGQIERMYSPANPSAKMKRDIADVKNEAMLLIRTAEKSVPHTKYYVLQRISNGEKPACASCGIEDINLLTLNHINHDGGIHRYQMRNGYQAKDDRQTKKNGYEHIYPWLLDNNFPGYYLNDKGEKVKLELNVLCYNCNYLDAVDFYGDNSTNKDKIELIGIQTRGRNRCEDCGMGDIRALNVYQYPNFYKWCKARKIEPTKSRKRNGWKLSYVKEHGRQDDLSVLCQNCRHKKMAKYVAATKRSRNRRNAPHDYRFKTQPWLDKYK